MRLICITGMHRSGTSLAARILNLLGVDLGPDEALMEATEANPRGYWEAEAVSHLNNDLLNHLGGWWKTMPAFPDGWEHAEDLDRYRDWARSILDDLFDDAVAAAGIKDPRMSVTLPFWRTVVDVDATVLVLRPPSEVAGSLDKRDGMDSERSASLWIDHVAGAWTHDPARHVVTYAELLSDPVDVAGRLAAALGLEEPDAETARAIAGFADPGLQRNVGYDAPPGPQMDAAGDLHRLLTEPSGSVDGLVARLLADRNVARLHAAKVEETRAERDAAVERRDELEEKMMAVRDRLHATEKRLVRRTAQLRGAEEQVEVWKDRYDRLSDRRVVRAGLAVAEALKPAVRVLRRRGS